MKTCSICGQFYKHESNIKVNDPCPKLLCNGKIVVVDDAILLIHLLKEKELSSVSSNVGLNWLMGYKSSMSFIQEEDIKYIEGLESLITDPSKIRNLYCDFESKNKKSSIKLCQALSQLHAFETYLDENDTIVHAIKPILYSEAKFVLNIAMGEAVKHSSELVNLMIEQDKKFSKDI